MTQGNLFDPVTGFIVVWLLLGAAITVILHLMGLKTLKVIGTAYAFALVPAMIVAYMLADESVR